MKTIIFDFDGTIADSFDFVLDFLIEAAGMEPIGQADVRAQYRQLSMLGIARRLGISWFRLPLLLIGGRKEMGRRMKHVKPVPGMVELVHELHREGHQLMIVSTNASRTIRTFLRQNDLEGQFVKIVGSISVFGKAPALRRILRAFRLKPNQALYVGDEVRDVEASQSVGVDCIAVAWGFADARFLAAAKPAALVKTPAELRQAIAGAKDL